ncbi:hypothetical protein GQ55_5G369200 [Panicum hallii var. hallii]|uniref:Uncharacterized protein n=1 Tax=Panicum hallii var. hallii TaxID=1504633 RepID=A0A2T7DML3_9POAL|nr:hypothetical protein GQ55_5G369200 [Panicum hallii var. hallii]
MCAALLPLHCPGPSHVPPPHSPRRSPASRWLPLASPHRPPPACALSAAGAAPRRRYRAGRHCAVLRRSSLAHASLSSSSHRSCRLRCPLLAMPRRAAGAEQLPRRPEGTPAPPAVLGLTRDRPLSLSLSSPKQCAAIKPDRTPSPRLLCLFFLLAPLKSARASSPEFAVIPPPRPNSLGLLLPHLLH